MKSISPGARLITLYQTLTPPHDSHVKVLSNITSIRAKFCSCVKFTSRNKLKPWLCGLFENRMDRENLARVFPFLHVTSEYDTRDHELGFPGVTQLKMKKWFSIRTLIFQKPKSAVIKMILIQSLLTVGAMGYSVLPLYAPYGTDQKEVL
jgi:hypothetical protein